MFTGRDRQAAAAMCACWEGVVYTPLRERGGGWGSFLLDEICVSL